MNLMKNSMVLPARSIAAVFALAFSTLLVGCAPGAAGVAPTNRPAVESAPPATAVPTDETVAAASSEAGPVVIESGGEVPFYARFGENETFDNGEWTVIVFYRSPACIPPDFNLNQFFHLPGEGSPGAFACTPPTVTSVETWQNGPQTDPAPLISEMTGRGAVPVWFISNDEIQSVQADGAVTIGELAELPSRQVGTAPTYTELLLPTQSNSRPLIQFSAQGTLEDGRAFMVEVSKGDENVSDHVTIDFTD